MASPGVRQLQHLSRVFGGLLDEFSPESVAVLGVSGGNGLEHIDPGRVKRVVGIDINPAYLDLARSRHGARLPGLELVCGDIASCELPPASFDLVYAALVFEYLEPAAAVGRIADWLKPGGVAAALLQLPSPAHGRVSETPYRSVRMLEPHIHPRGTRASAESFRRPRISRDPMRHGNARRRQRLLSRNLPALNPRLNPRRGL